MHVSLTGAQKHLKETPSVPNQLSCETRRNRVAPNDMPKNVATMMVASSEQHNIDCPLPVANSNRNHLYILKVFKESKCSLSPPTPEFCLAFSSVFTCVFVPV